MTLSARPDAERPDLEKPAAPRGWFSPWLLLLLVPIAVVGGLLAAVWPIVVLTAAFLIATGVLLARAPAYGFVAALLLAGVEGMLKARFTAEGVPSADAIVAGLIDATLFLITLRLLVMDRGRTLAEVWRGATRSERILWGLVGAWLLISVFQIPQSGNLNHGLKGFRLTQAYVPLALAGTLLYARREHPERLTGTILWVFAAVAGYSALRGLIGPSSWEESYALSRTPLAQLGELTRDIGSFSAPQELASYLAPVGVFALILAFLDRRFRWLGGATFVLSAIAIIESYVRIGLVALLLGSGVLVLVVVFGREMPRRTRLAATLVVIGVVIGGYSLALVAGGASNFARTRAQGLTHPLSDASLKTRLKTWKHSLQTTLHHPLGTGVGTLGHATEVNHQSAYVDNSYLKVLQEQGVFALLFIIGTVGSAVAVGVRLTRAGPRREPVAVAALGAVTAFLLVCLLGEYIELPGKIVAWAMFGIAIGVGAGCFGSRDEGA